MNAAPLISENEIAELARAHGLAIVGAFEPEPEDLAPVDVVTILLLGPRGSAMWDAFRESPEHADGGANPLDRWSGRVIGGLAERLGAQAFFPFGGPPHQPFIRWAARGEPAFSSPVGMQVSPERGLWSSYRGALGFGARIALGQRPRANPCLDCSAPCLQACPVSALADGQYDVPACIGHLTGPEGAPCRDGCLVRRACPAGQDVLPPLQQRRFHMAAFRKSQGGAVASPD